ncbi:MAG: CBS domain-containing protein [Persicimonas sp.]
MTVRDLMTENPQACSKNSSLQEVAKMMVDCDCGMIPVVEQNGERKVVGTITDRDITIRAVAKGKNPLDLNVGEVMSDNPICISVDGSDEEAEKLMSRHQVRRLPVVDNNNVLVGIIAQADIARKEPEGEAGEVVKNISKPSGGVRSQKR